MSMRQAFRRIERDWHAYVATHARVRQQRHQRAAAARVHRLRSRDVRQRAAGRSGLRPRQHVSSSAPGHTPHVRAALRVDGSTRHAGVSRGGHAQLVGAARQPSSPSRAGRERRRHRHLQSRCVGRLSRRPGRAFREHTGGHRPGDSVWRRWQSLQHGRLALSKRDGCSRCQESANDASRTVAGIRAIGTHARSAKLDGRRRAARPPPHRSACLQRRARGHRLAISDRVHEIHRRRLLQLSPAESNTRRKDAIDVSSSSRPSRSSRDSRPSPIFWAMNMPARCARSKRRIRTSSGRFSSPRREAPFEPDLERSIRFMASGCGPMSTCSWRRDWRWIRRADVAALTREWAARAFGHDPLIVDAVANALIDTRRAILEGFYIRPFAEHEVRVPGLELPPLMWIFEWDIAGRLAQPAQPRVSRHR